MDPVDKGVDFPLIEETLAGHVEHLSIPPGHRHLSCPEPDPTGTGCSPMGRPGRQKLDYVKAVPMGWLGIGNDIQSLWFRFILILLSKFYFNTFGATTGSDRAC